jgi:mono/diheme cytochrome c family protein
MTARWRVLSRLPALLSLFGASALADQMPQAATIATPALHGFTIRQTDKPPGKSLDEPLAVFRKQVRPPVADLPLPPGVTRAQLAHGDEIFHGEAAHGHCSSCHGVDAEGSPTGPDITTGHYIWADGSVDGIKHGMMHNMTIAPGMDGDLSDQDLADVAAYIWALGRRNQLAQ